VLEDGGGFSGEIMFGSLASPAWIFLVSQSIWIIATVLPYMAIHLKIIGKLPNFLGHGP
jgi:hypothetical protein